MNRFFSFFNRRQNHRKPTTKAALPNRFRPTIENLERRDVPSTFLQVVTTPNYPTLGQFDALSVTVDNQSYQYAGIQFGAKVASSLSDLPGNGVPNFYSFCIDITQDANLTSAYPVTTSPDSTIPNGAKVAFLYQTNNSPVGSPLDKTHAAALQLAIWETEYDNNIATDHVINNWLNGLPGGIVTASDQTFMDSPPYNGSTTALATAETNAILSTAANYLSAVPSNPTTPATIFLSNSPGNQGLIGAGPSIMTTATPTSGTVGATTMNDAAILSGGNNPTGTITFTLTAPNGSTAATEMVTVNGDGTYPTPNGVPATQAGTYYWVASYGGDTLNTSATSGPTDEPVVISPASPSINTTQQPASATVGSSIADKAFVSGGDNPSGTVTFNLYNNPTASGTPLFSDTESLSGGTATSKGFTAGATGTDYWVATYNGDANNNPVTSGTALEPVTIIPSNSLVINTTQQPASATVGSSIADKATVSGGVNPTGTVTFNLYNNSTASGTPLFSDTETLSGGTAFSKSFTTSATGTDYWVATYNGDSNNSPVTSGPALEPVSITPATPAINTIQQPASATVGSPIADKAIVSGGVNPTGTVTFNLYNNSTASGTPLFSDTEALSGGTATSKGFIANATGTDYWVATYNGDSNNNPVTSGTALEPVVISSGTLSINGSDFYVEIGTVLNTGTTGTPIPGTTIVLIGTDSFGNAVNQMTTTNSNGQYSFTGLNPSNASGYTVIEAPPTIYTHVGQTSTTPGANTYTPPGTPSIVSNIVVNLGQTSTDNFFETSQPLIETCVTTSGTVNTTILSDSATLSGGKNPTGTITFTLTAPDGSTAATETVTVNGDNTYYTPQGVLATEVGTYYWVAAYSGDSNNPSAISGAKDEPVIIIPATPAINTTQQPANATVGSTIADKATVSGGNSPTGTVTFNLYNNPNGSGTPLFSDTETLSGGTATSKSFTTSATGTDYWVATYNGDSNNAPVTSGTALEPVTVPPATPAINTTQQPASAIVGSSIADKATVSGGDNPTGTVTFNLYDNPNGSGTPLFTDTETLSGGTATSNGFIASATGTDYWVATYNGDSNNSAVTSGTTLEPVTITPPGTPGISIVKLTNGVNDPDPNGANVPQLTPGSPVTWTYLVTNTGNVPFARSSVVVTDNQPGVTPTAVLASGGFVLGDINDNNILDPGETWTFSATGTALNLSSPPAGVTTVPLGTSFGGITLGSAANYAVVAINGFNINGPGTITGNVASGNTTVLTNPAVIDGTVFYSGNISGNSTPTGGEVNTNLSQVFADAQSASSAAFAQPATQTFGTINSSTTINGNGGLNVVDVSGINLSSGALTLNGTASDVFIVNVEGGGITSSNSNITISGGVTPNHVLINVSGPVTITGGGANNFYGTILDPNGTVTVHDKLLTGELIGNTITDTSGFSVTFPPHRAYQNIGEVTVTVTGTTLVATYVSNYINPGTSQLQGVAALSNSLASISAVYPAPAVTSLSVTSAFVGSATTSITLTGSDFVNGATADFNGVPLNTTFVSSTQLTAVVPVADLTTAGSNAITVVNPSPGGGTSATKTFTVQYNPNVVFTSPANGAVFTLRQSGSNLQTLENGVVFDTRPLSSIHSLTINGAAGVSNALVLDLGTGGFFTLPGFAPIFFNGGANGNNTVQVTGGTLMGANLTYSNGSNGVGTVIDAATNAPLYFGFNNTQFADLSNNHAISQLSFTLPNSAAAIAVTDNGSGAVSGLASVNHAVPTIFKDPSSVLFLNGGSAGNAINLVRTATTQTPYVILAGAGHNALAVDFSHTSANDVDFVTAAALDSSVLGSPIYYSASGGDFSGGVLLSLGSGNDYVAVESTASKALTTVQTGNGNNTILVSSVPNTTTGSLSGLAGPLSVRGGTGKNQLTLSDAAQTAANTYYLTNNAITGSALPFTVLYAGNFSGGVNVVGGSGNDTFNVLSQAATSPVALYTGNGNNTINVAVTTTSAYQLTMVGGSGSNTLGVYDTSGSGSVTKHASSTGSGVIDVTYSLGDTSAFTYYQVQQVGSNETIH